jgi:hypothetical protein
VIAEPEETDAPGGGEGNPQSAILVLHDREVQTAYWIRSLEGNHDKETSSPSEALRLHRHSDLDSGRDNLLRSSACAACQAKSSAASETKSSPAGAGESRTTNSIKPGASHHSQSSSFNHSKSGATDRS